MNRQRQRGKEACCLDSGWITYTQSCLPIQTGPFFFATVRRRYAHQIPSYLPLGAGCDQRGQSSRLSGPAEGNTDRVNPMGHGWSLDSVAIGLMTGQHSFSPLWDRDRYVDKTCREGLQLSVCPPPPQHS